MLIVTAPHHAVLRSEMEKDDLEEGSKFLAINALEPPYTTRPHFLRRQMALDACPRRRTFRPIVALKMGSLRHSP